MGIFSSIMDKIVSSAHAATDSITDAVRDVIGGHRDDDKNQTTPVNPTTTATSTSTVSGAGTTFDVNATLEHLQRQSGQQLNWRTSIVDLLKLLGLDSSLEARKQLAAELHYPGDTNDSAKMNTWLHAAVMRKLAENGGRVPDDLR